MGVQLADGQVVTAQTSQVNDRSNPVLNNFVEKWLYLSFNWTTDDLTVEIEKPSRKVPRTTSMLLPLPSLPKRIFDNSTLNSLPN
ncbi:MAG: hypothetical protein HC763_29260 [Hydrococcus sp. CRU_1_1]|nr:hypothetical protein [Hydrococcus sp. CRU_1_1]